MTTLVRTPDCGQYALAGQSATLRRHLFTTYAVVASSGPARLTGRDTRLRHRRAFAPRVYTIRGTAATLRCERVSV